MFFLRGFTNRIVKIFTRVCLSEGNARFEAMNKNQKIKKNVKVKNKINCA